MGFQRLQEPSGEPVQLADAKTHLHLTTDDEDMLLTGILAAAREWCEAYCRRKFVTQKWRMYLDAFPGYIDQRLGGNIVTTPIAIGATSYMAGIRWAIVPPWSPVDTIDRLAFIAPDGSTTVMTQDVDYIVDTISQPARVCPTFGKFWPISRIQTNAVMLDWTCGYGDPNGSPVGTIPSSIKTAILMLAAHLYDNRWGVMTDSLKEVPMGIESLLSPYRDLRL